MDQTTTVIVGTLIVAFWFAFNLFMDKLSETVKNRKK